MLGYPTVAAHEVVDPTEVEDEDEVLLEFCREHGALLITRDRQLAQRTQSILITADSVPEQVAEVLEFLGDEAFLDPDESRCPECNVQVRRVATENPGPLDVTWECPGCRRKYWVGGHWRDMEETIDRIKEALRRVSSPRRGHSRE
ncbi:Mut7-C RNAse domain-containing protein [Methanopyrus sp.]